jgi:hypothetical protein
MKQGYEDWCKEKGYKPYLTKVGHFGCAYEFLIPIFWILLTITVSLLIYVGIKIITF